MRRNRYLWFPHMRSLVHYTILYYILYTILHTEYCILYNPHTNVYIWGGTDIWGFHTCAVWHTRYTILHTVHYTTYCYYIIHIPMCLYEEEQISVVSTHAQSGLRKRSAPGLVSDGSEVSSQIRYVPSTVVNTSHSLPTRSVLCGLQKHFKLCIKGLCRKINLL